jgi:hypothetical protein
MENKIQAELKFLFSPDADPLERFESEANDMTGGGKQQ